MPALSPGAVMAWRLAAREAARTRQPYIEAEAMCIGICGLGTWLCRRRSGVLALEELRADAVAVEEPLWAVGVSPTRLCYAVHAALGYGTTHHPPKTILHRSPACRTVFRRAEVFATAAHADQVHCVHLLAALLEHPGALLTVVVAQFGLTVHTLHAHLVASLGIPETRTTAAPTAEHDHPLIDMDTDWLAEHDPF